MSFNRGYLCNACGPCEKPDTKKIGVRKYIVCPTCAEVVTEWVRPINERPGRCRTCSGGAFKLALLKGELLRCCKTCKEIVNPDFPDVIIRQGKVLS
jgi:hypothetical protein